ncbi:hypothetical protein D9M72_432330 [compost metagenome]
MRALGDAARHLDVDQLVRQAVGLDHLADQLQPLPGAVRIGNPDALQAAVQAGQMLVPAEWLAVVVRDDFVDAIAKDEAAIEDGDAGFGEGGQGAVEVDDGVGHGASARDSKEMPDSFTGRQASSCNLRMRLVTRAMSAPARRLRLTAPTYTELWRTEQLDRHAQPIRRAGMEAMPSWQ